MEYQAAIQEARQLNAARGYDIQTWLLALNREARNDPERLRRVAVILAGLTDSPTPRSTNSTRRSADSS